MSQDLVNGRKFTKARVEDNMRIGSSIHFRARNAVRDAYSGRSVYEQQRDMGAVFRLNYGWEHPLFRTDTPESAGFAHPRFETVSGQGGAGMLRQLVGIIDISLPNTAAQGLERRLAERRFANAIPKTVGRSCLTPLIGVVMGGITGDFVTWPRTILDRGSVWQVSIISSSGKWWR
jgi:dimethylglycine dehydrogenase